MERHARHLNSGADEALFGSRVPRHMPPALAVSAPLLSHTPTPFGSLVKERRIRDAGDDSKGEAANSSQLVYIYPRSWIGLTLVWWVTVKADELYLVIENNICTYIVFFSVGCSSQVSLSESLCRCTSVSDSTVLPVKVKKTHPIYTLQKKQLIK